MLIHKVFDEIEQLPEGLLLFLSFHQLGKELVIYKFLPILLDFEFTKFSFHVPLALQEHLELAAGLGELDQDRLHLVLY